MPPPVRLTVLCVVDTAGSVKTIKVLRPECDVESVGSPTGTLTPISSTSVSIKAILILPSIGSSPLFTCVSVNTGMHSSAVPIGASVISNSFYRIQKRKAAKIAALRDVSAKPNHNTPCPAALCLATPSLPCRAGSSRTKPGSTLPCLPRLISTRLCRPNLVTPAEPRRAEPRRIKTGLTTPCLPRRTSPKPARPCRTQPCHACLAMPSRFAL